MKSPVVVKVSDIGQPRRDADNTIQLNVLDATSKLPFLKVQLQRHELAKLLSAKMVGHLDNHQIDGYIVT